MGTPSDHVLARGAGRARDAAPADDGGAESGEPDEDFEGRTAALEKCEGIGKSSIRRNIGSCRPSAATGLKYSAAPASRTIFSAVETSSPPWNAVLFLETPLKQDNPPHYGPGNICPASILPDIKAFTPLPDLTSNDADPPS